jgi:hypothetical protein
MSKTEFFPIHCSNSDLCFLSNRNIALSSFPCKYLGHPLHFKKSTRSMLQPLVQKVGNRLPGWKRCLLSYPGRETLIKTVLSAMPTFFLTIFKMRKWAISRIDKYRRGLLWKGKDGENVSGVHCSVNWQTCTGPRKWGGLGIKDLDKFDRALHLR